MEGKEFFVLPNYLNPINKGTKSAVIKSKLVDQFLEFRASKLGFPIERKLADNLFVLTFFGDSQQEIDDFVQNLKSIKT